MAATVNVYVPDDLKARLDKANLNLSSFAQAAWEEALAREEAMAETKDGQVEHSVDAEDDDGDPVELRFTGTLIASDGMGTDVYLTDKDEVLWVDEEANWGTFPSDEASEEGLRNLLGNEEAVADACAALGIKRVVQL